ncbi:solute carrier family 15 member 3-like [Corticium candelabrum]|uniref:solute carrier family 15 member 3-like n=1 Tax=Corticium candelabrum TaxID=121492 RepID=UPI002E36A9BD|nr:solute carrier family 15 member 3-like [Corticium candelabrum]
MDGDPLVQSGVSSFSERSSRSDVSKRRFGPCVSPGVLAVIMLLLVQMLERVAYYTITNNIEPYIHTYLHTFELGQESALLSTVIVGTTWILSPLYGWLSDSRFGHYPVLVGCLAAYLLGAGLILSSAIAFAFSNMALARGLYYPGCVCLLLWVRLEFVPLLCLSYWNN